jgi:DNA adenine methylase
METAKPFLKWVGGKRQLVEEIDKRLPKAFKTGEIDTYIEPFLGGGAIFFHIVQKYPHLKHIFISDANKDLINCYLSIKYEVNTVIGYLTELEKQYQVIKDRKELYYSYRDNFNNFSNYCSPDSIKDNKIFNSFKAALFIFLNKTCFNGLYRVNKKGKFNVPMGNYKNPTICDRDNLLKVSEVLQKVNISCFTYIHSHIDSLNYFMYLDPPYKPLSESSSFTSYTKDSFGDKEQKELSIFCNFCSKCGNKWLLSNSDCSFFYDIYNEENIIIEKVGATRMVNSKSSSRGKINELLIRNYEV